MVGKQIYMSLTHLDITYVVIVASQYMQGSKNLGTSRAAGWGLAPRQLGEGLGGFKLIYYILYKLVPIYT